MKKILVPTDFSPIAHNAFLYALGLAKQLNAQLVLLHVSDQSGNCSCAGTEHAGKEGEHKLLKKAEGCVQDTWRRFTGQCDPAYSVKECRTAEADAHLLPCVEEQSERDSVKITTTCRRGVTVQEILKASHEFGTDLVVMGMRGAGAQGQAFLGSTTLQLIKENKVPVLAVPATKQFSNIQPVVFALNLTRLPSSTLLQPLRELLGVFNKLHVLHVYKNNIRNEEREKAFEAVTKIDGYFRNLMYKLFFKEKEDVAEGIQHYVREEQADLLVLVPSQHTFLDGLLRRSNNGRLAVQAFTPLLALPDTSVAAAPQLSKVLEEAA